MERAWAHLINVSSPLRKQKWLVVVPLQNNVKISCQDDVYLDIFEGMASLCGWFKGKWGFHIQALLIREAQLAA